jgi:hypothetical protein
MSRVRHLSRVVRLPWQDHHSLRGTGLPDESWPLHERLLHNLQERLRREGLGEEGPGATRRCPPVRTPR